MARAIDADRLLKMMSHWKPYMDMDKVRKAVQNMPTLTPPNEPLSPYPDGDTSILACPCCGSGEYLHNEDGNEQNYCGQCGQAIDWSRPPEGEEAGNG